MTGTTSRRRPYAPRVPMAERREQLLDAAIRVIVRDGYGGVSIDAVAREAGVTRPVVYGAFDGLGPLLMSLLDRQQARAMAQLMATLPDPVPVDVRGGEAGADLGDLVGRTVRRMVETVAGDPLTWRPILAASAGTPREVRDRIAGDRERVRTRISGLMEAGLGARVDVVDLEIMSHATLAVLEHFGRLLLEDPQHFDVDRLVGAARAWVRALAA